MEETKPQKTILYVDDEEDNLTVFKSAFRRNYKVITALSAAEGLEIVKNEHVDLIITDQRMPHMTGIQFLKNLPDETLSIRMILTGYSDIEAVIDAINTGKVYRYITKPWDKEELKITLDNALDTLDLKRKNAELILNLKEANEELENKVKERTKELEEKNKDITDSITYAKRIQDSILPELINFKNNFQEHFVLYKPKAIVSGDLYWFLEKDNTIYFATIDCTGHGVPGAFMSLIAFNFLNRIIGEKNITHPSDILFELNSEVNLVLKQNMAIGSPDGMDLAFCKYEKSTKNLAIATAMRPAVICQNGKHTVIEPNKFSIGGVSSSEEKKFLTQNIEIKDGDKLYLFTDGYADQFGGELNKKIMSKGFYEVLQSIDLKSFEDQRVYLDNYFELWKGKNEQIDDVLIVGIKF